MSRLAAAWRRLLPWLRVLHLHRPADLALLWLPLLWGLWLSAGGRPAPLTVASLLLATLLLRCAAWLLLGLANAHQGSAGRTLPTLLRALPRPLTLALALSTAGALLLFAAAGWPTLVAALGGAALGAAYLWIRHRTFLGELVLALALAAGSIAGFTAAGVVPNKTAWLLYTAAVLWSTAYLTQRAALHLQQHARLGIKSLTMLFGVADRWLIGLLQAAALLALWLAARQESLGVFMAIALLTAAALGIYQQLLMRGGTDQGYRRAYLDNVWFGIAIFCGILFHYLCRLQGHC